ncbi:MAG TPA: glycosyltransferase family 9 protein, partial [Acetobacteraceae bacterium]
QPELLRLVAGIRGIAEVVPSGQTLPPFDMQCPLLSLPRVFRTRLETVPATVPYLPVDPDMVADWDSRLPQDGMLRVGICWAGAAHLDDVGARLIDQRRSIGLDPLAPLGGIGGVHWVSLQKSPAGGSSPRIAGFPMLDLMDQVSDFADTAALMANLDLVISVDTAVAHLAGALGRPVWMLSRYDGCWRWLHGRNDTPWYPSMRIYRQERPLEWSGVVGQVRRDLLALTSARDTGREVIRAVG